MTFNELVKSGAIPVGTELVWKEEFKVKLIRPQLHTVLLELLMGNFINHLQALRDISIMENL